jgi:hypothetical protein
VAVSFKFNDETAGFHKVRGISQLLEEVLDSSEGLYFTQIVMRNVHSFVRKILNEGTIWDINAPKRLKSFVKVSITEVGV